MSIINALPNNLQNGTTADASQVMANFNEIVNDVNSNAAANGVNNDITKITGLTTPLSQAQGGTEVFVGAASTGSANAQVISATVPANFTLTSGYILNFIAGFTNTDTLQVNANATGLTTVQKITPSGLVNLSGGEVIAGQMISLFVSGGVYQLISVFGERPGSIKFSLFATPEVGWLGVNGDSIGSAASGATHANANLLNVYTAWWNNVSTPSGNTQAIVTGGALGVSAAADFAANRKMTLPNWAGMTAYGVDGTLTYAGAEGGASTVSAAGNLNFSSITLDPSKLPTISITMPVGNVDNGVTTKGASGDSGRSVNVTNFSTNAGGGSFTPAGTFAGTGTSVIQPVFAGYWRTKI